MSAKDEPEAAEPTGKLDEAADLKKAAIRFAQYTSPVMLATLASAGRDMAFAQGSPVT